MKSTGSNNAEATEREEKSFVSRLIGITKRYPFPVVGFVGSLAGIAIALTILFLTLSAERAHFRMFFDVTVTLVSVALLMVFMGLTLADVMKKELDRSRAKEKEELERRIQASTENLRTLISAGVSVELVDTPDDVWGHSVRILEELASEQKPGRAYDVSTYMNKIRYEEAVVKVLESGTSVHRLFFFERGSDIEADQALEWFFDCITLGKEVAGADVESFQDELCIALKDRQQDVLPSLSDKNLERLQAVVRKQQLAVRNGFLKIKHLGYHLHSDFVGSSCIRESHDGVRMREAELCEVMANFKTDRFGETYVTGIRAVGRLAIGYRDFFFNVLWG